MQPSAGPAAGEVAPTTTLPPLPQFSPHESTTQDGGVVADTERSEPGVLGSLAGVWAGEGLNVIWTPSQVAATGNAHFLQLAATAERQEYQLLDGSIPNRGLTQPDLFMSGARYVQEISSNGKSLHFEQGVWLNVPATTDPPVGASVVRMASIPHGTTINAQGAAPSAVAGGPTILAAPITPFTIDDPASLVPMDEQRFSSTSKFRSDPVEHGFDQDTLDDVNAFLRSRVPADVTETTTIDMTTAETSAIPGGGVANTAFLDPNALASSTAATVWLMCVAGEELPSVMAYSQTVLLDFSGLSWPHVTVGFLTRQSA